MNILNDKIVFISGSRSGIGRSTALLVAKKGARLILHCKKKGDCKDLIQEIIQNGGNAKEIVGDLSRVCLLYTSPSPRDRISSRMPSSA